MDVFKKIDLINLIQELKTFEHPKIELEQYITDAISTTDLLFHISYERQELSENIIVDLGCGTGNLSITAGLLGAEKVYAVDIDSDALRILKENVELVKERAPEANIEKKIEVIQIDLQKEFLDAILNPKLKEYMTNQKKIITISNPPFGVHTRGLDMVFLMQAMLYSDVIYSIHLSNPKSIQFLTQKIEDFGGTITNCGSLRLMLKHTYEFQSKSQKKIQTEILRIDTQKVQKVVLRKKLKDWFNPNKIK